jgi:hypothetical protein
MKADGVHIGVHHPVHPDLDGALGDHVDAAGQQVQANQSF